MATAWEGVMREGRGEEGKASPGAKEGVWMRELK